MKVVLDTNVLVSAFVFPGGAPEHVYRQVLSGEVTVVVSAPLLTELGRVLVDKFGWDDAHAGEALAQLVRVGEVVEPDERVNDITDDPADNRILEAAAAGAADVIVSGDRHLRSLGMWRGIRILEPAPFLAKFGEQANSS